MWKVCKHDYINIPIKRSCLKLKCAMLNRTRKNMDKSHTHRPSPPPPCSVGWSLQLALLDTVGFISLVGCSLFVKSPLTTGDLASENRSNEHGITLSLGWNDQEVARTWEFGLCLGVVLSLAIASPALACWNHTRLSLCHLSTIVGVLSNSS